SRTGRARRQRRGNPALRKVRLRMRRPPAGLHDRGRPGVRCATDGAARRARIRRPNDAQGEPRMSSLDKARDTQLRNIEAKTGRTLDQLRALLAGSGLAKHGELRSFAMETLGLGY